MGNYNPYVPIILGQEWVPIRDENVTFAPTLNVVELGHEFTLASTRQVRNGRFYVNTLPANPAQKQTVLFSIYPQGTEDLTGPIRKVIIPVSSGNVTGSNITATGSVANALSQPGDFESVTANFSGSQQELSMFFDINRYVQLANKRILNVSLLYSGYIQRYNSTTGLYSPFVDDDVISPATLLSIQNDAASQIQFYQSALLSNTGSLLLNTTVNPTSGDPFADQTLQVMNLGDINAFWSTSVGPNGTNDRMPWRYVDLQRFEASASNRLHVHVIFQTPTSQDAIVLEYVAMQVTYCEEQRVIYGGRQFTYEMNMNAITLRDLSHNADPILPVGRYTAALSVVNPGDISFGQGVSTAFPNLNGVRELYSIPPHPGVQVNVTTIEGDTFTSEQTHILPHLSLHASGGTLTEPHVYGRQAAAQVYGSVFATQEIYDDAVGVATVYPQVRWYARRFGADSGTLTLTGTGSLGAHSVSITSTDFDGLPEIIDGWREVTLRFANPPTMGTLTTPDPSWQWRAPAATAGTRWEILAASAPALSGIPGNLYNLVPSPNQLYAATYQPPAGASVELTWMPQGIASPPVTGATADQATDAAILFSQDPFTVTGFAITPATQIVSGIGLDCGNTPCCIPTGISYNRLTWPLPAGTAAITDTFTRTEAAGWGTADTGQVWTNDVGTAAQFSVNGTTGLHSHTAGAAMISALTGNIVDADATVTISIDSIGSSADSAIYVRYVDSNNYYRLVYGWTTGTLEIGERVASVNTTLATRSGSPSLTSIKLRLAVVGTLLLGKMWDASAPEPDDWMLTATDSSLTTGRVAVSSFNSAVAKVFTFDNLTVGPPDYYFGAYELQRWDSVTDWQTIMSASSPAVTGFNDFEARVGLDSVYRIRATNLYDFAGAWSTQVTGAVAAPGVEGCNVDGGVLIFTTNEDQTGLSNLAYSPNWENSGAEETFDFPEAEQVIFQRMYGRDGSVAFHGTERGFEHFQRMLLIQQAAIDPIRLANLRGLRDLAWADLSYVCVRDDVGDRWLSNVRVPAESVRLRALYMATVDITEVTQTASPVDPAA